MKKLRFLLVIAVVSLLSTTVVAQETTKEVQAFVNDAQQDMKEVKLGDLPDAVKKTLGETFGEYSAEKALKAKKDDTIIYYVKLLKDGQFMTVMINEEGKVIEPEGN